MVAGLLRGAIKGHVAKATGAFGARVKQVGDKAKDLLKR